MLIIFSPIALVFLAAFLLTMRWYLRVGSIPGLILGAIAQPLFTALLFVIGLTYLASWMRDEAAFNFESQFKLDLRVFILFTVVIANPLALMLAIPFGGKIMKTKQKEYYDPSDGFELLMAAAIISGLCAIAGIFIFYVFVSRS